MNPGLMDSRCVVERQGTARDELGQKTEEWLEITRFRARRLKVKGDNKSAVRNTQEREMRQATFRRRSRHAEIIQRGDRLRENGERGVRETVWDITTILPVDGGQYVDVVCESVE